MAGMLVQELQKRKPFDSLQQEAFLNILRTADYLTRALEELLKPHQLSPSQYNVLRILRGVSQTHTPNSDGHPCGMPCKAIGELMLTRDPDITRLLDRLEARALIARRRDTADRRVVSTRITPEGLRLLKDLDQQVAEFHRTQFPNLPETRLTQLIDLLEQARAAG
jgi:MarR family transcriptional regulator, organic hydroperoxide resistance regulator